MMRPLITHTCGFPPGVLGKLSQKLSTSDNDAAESGDADPSQASDFLNSNLRFQLTFRFNGIKGSLVVLVLSSVPFEGLVSLTSTMLATHNSKHYCLEMGIFIIYYCCGATRSHTLPVARGHFHSWK